MLTRCFEALCNGHTLELQEHQTDLLVVCLSSLPQALLAQDPERYLQKQRNIFSFLLSALLFFLLKHPYISCKYAVSQVHKSGVCVCPKSCPNHISSVKPAADATVPCRSDPNASADSASSFKRRTELQDHTTVKEITTVRIIFLLLGERNCSSAIIAATQDHGSNCALCIYAG